MDWIVSGDEHVAETGAATYVIRPKRKGVGWELRSWPRPAPLNIPQPQGQQREADYAELDDAKVRAAQWEAMVRY